VDRAFDLARHGVISPGILGFSSLGNDFGRIITSGIGKLLNEFTCAA
jgi:hypothetical protein